jgi:hypothetical protein
MAAGQPLAALQLVNKQISQELLAHKGGWGGGCWRCGRRVRRLSVGQGLGGVEWCGVGPLQKISSFCGFVTGAGGLQITPHKQSCMYRSSRGACLWSAAADRCHIADAHCTAGPGSSCGAGAAGGTWPRGGGAAGGGGTPTAGGAAGRAGGTAGGAVAGCATGEEGWGLGLAQVGQFCGVQSRWVGGTLPGMMCVRRLRHAEVESAGHMHRVRGLDAAGGVCCCCWGVWLGIGCHCASDALLS